MHCTRAVRMCLVSCQHIGTSTVTPSIRTVYGHERCFAHVRFYRHRIVFSIPAQSVRERNSADRLRGNFRFYFREKSRRIEISKRTQWTSGKRWRRFKKKKMWRKTKAIYYRGEQIMYCERHAIEHHLFRPMPGVRVHFPAFLFCHQKHAANDANVIHQNGMPFASVSTRLGDNRTFAVHC